MVLYHDNRCVNEGEINHSPKDFKALITLIQETHAEVVFEATGVYSKVFEQLFETNNILYYRLNPLESKLQTTSMRQRKNDKNDAHKLAQTHFKFERMPSLQEKAIFRELRLISKLYNEVHSELLIQRNHLHSELYLVFPGVEVLYQNNLSLYSLNIIEHYTHPDILIRDSITKIKNYILKQTTKHMSKRQAKEKAEHLLYLAENAYPAVSENSYSVTIVRYRIGIIKDLLTQKKQFRADLIEVAASLNAFNCIKSIPGISDLTAALLIAELGDIYRFKTHKQMNAYVGIDIRTYQSGSVHYKDRIQKRGNSRARMILYFSIQNMLKKQKVIENHLIDYYYKLKKPPYDKKHKVAMVACMNKLLKTIHFLVLNDQYYDYAKSPRS